MANVDKAFGLRPYKGLNVGSAVQEANKYNISTSGYDTSIFIMLLLTARPPLRITIQLIQRHLEAGK